MAQTDVARGQHVMLPWKPTVEPEEYQGNLYDQVIDAYFEGHQKGSWLERTIKEALQENLNKAMDLSIDFRHHAEEKHGFEISRMFLKMEAQNSYSVAIVLPLDIYYGDTSRLLTGEMIAIELANDSPKFSINFTVIPNKKSLNVEKLFANGYIFEHVEKRPASA